MKRYLVTGGAGFIGSNFVKYLLEDLNDVFVVNLDNLEYSGNLANLKEIETQPNYKFVKGNICDEDLVQKLFETYDFDYVVHFAAMTHVDRSINNTQIFVKANVEGTGILLESARQAWLIESGYQPGKKFLYVSTDEVYGDLGKGEYFTETTPLAPRNIYSASKVGAEMLVRAYRETHNLPVNVTRCSNNYGPNQFPEKFIPLLINNCINHKKLPIYGDGMAVRDWLYVKDHCIAIKTVLERGEMGEVYNIGGHNEKTALEIATIVVEYIHANYDKTVNKDLICHIADRKGHDLRYAIDPKKTNEELKWKPTTKFEDGIRMTIDWYMNNQDWLKNVVNEEYKEYYKQYYLQ